MNSLKGFKLYHLAQDTLSKVAFPVWMVRQLPHQWRERAWKTVAVTLYSYTGEGAHPSDSAQQALDEGSRP